ncbi:uncharacterized protein DSM5745_08208 [Aspergillus mulundensis]|uniref:Integral membrane protein n=1 Tax=Aspergillus mulundensis TaxID=1810919 RepID=A0A3D8R9H5_9EURO|nr:hypothetical protein DSM5745_08208 [Aspergillus mulundensis]RDW70697.1 hypothetical protein DSM5745_08208 [Aspergillus mulundensis]
MLSGSSGTSGSWPFAPSLSLSTFFYLSLALTTSILAQDVQLRPTAASSTFPACGLTCSALSQADDSCTPPTAQTTNRQTYVSCFCQSDLLKNLQTTAAGTCDDTCTSSDDQQLLQQWYVDFCNSGGDTDSTSGTTEDSTSNSNSGNNNNSSNNNNNGTSSADSAADTSSSSAANRRAPQSWWDGHYQWVIMVIVLAVGFTAIAILGIWLKKRHDRKHPPYHATQGASGSRVFNQDSLGPDLVPRARSVNTVSFASSSRTNVGPPNRQVPTPSPLQNAQGVDHDVEVREAPR